MNKKLRRGFLRAFNRIKRHPRVLPYKGLLKRQEYWKLTRESMSRGLGIGLFMSWIPIPFQMIPSTLLSLVFKAHIPTAVISVWWSNPITFVPMAMSAHTLGFSLLSGIFEVKQMSMNDISDGKFLEFFSNAGEAILLPVLVGSFGFAALFGLIGYLLPFLFFHKIQEQEADSQDEPKAESSQTKEEKDNSK